MKPYHPSEIETKWQQRWAKKPLHQAVDPPKGGQVPSAGRRSGKKFYGMVEFPYPSGEGLHIGHAFTNTILDVLIRKKRREGLNVLYPMGWDAFGLPTENYAIKTGVHPAVATKKNTNAFRRQMKRLALDYDWSREVNTTDPNYYKWSQWIFLQLFKHGLAYKKETQVGWCPACKIILANEEIVAGKCERCGAEAERRNQAQWLLRITAYADRLADELDLVDYPDYVKASQRNWIGRSEGITIEYPLVGKEGSIACYSTRPDTNFGTTFVVASPEHPRVMELTTPENRKAVSKYIEMSKKKSELERADLEKEKTGVFTGSYFYNRAIGKDKKWPIWVSDFVILTSGTGMVVGVPAHDKRDFDFAKKYGLEIVPVIKPGGNKKWDYDKAPFLDIDDAEVFNSDFLNGLPALKAKGKIIDEYVKRGWGKRAVNYHLRDWIFSRQHYWGEPIPMVFCQSCADKGVSWFDLPEAKRYKNLGKAKQKLVGWFPLAEKELPLKLPEVKKYQPTSTGESPLANIKSWLKVACPHCQKPARRETDTMPNWAGSSWYFLRYIDPDNKCCLADSKKLKYWLPVDLYLGGAEHTTLHLLYSRFWHKFLNDIDAVPGKEPYAARRQHGVILGEDGFRMSKSRGNVITPEAVVKKFGADTLRVYLMFMGPYDATMPWSTKGVEGAYRFLTRVWRIFQSANWRKNKVSQKTSPELKSQLHRLIKRVGEDIEELKHNTAIAALMEFLNAWSASRRRQTLSQGDAGVFVQLLAPFAPFMAEELWCEVLGNQFSVHQQPWPKFDTKLAKEEKATIIIQVNGKLRDRAEVPNAQTKNKAEMIKLAKESQKVRKYLKDKQVKKEIFVPGKLVNLVIGQG